MRFKFTFILEQAQTAQIYILHQMAIRLSIPLRTILSQNRFLAWILCCITQSGITHLLTLFLTVHLDDVTYINALPLNFKIMLFPFVRNGTIIQVPQTVKANQSKRKTIKNLLLTIRIIFENFNVFLVALQTKCFRFKCLGRTVHLVVE